MKISEVYAYIEKLEGLSRNMEILSQYFKNDIIDEERKHLEGCMGLEGSICEMLNEASYEFGSIAVDIKAEVDEIQVGHIPGCRRPSL